ncbi:hypothetical protein Salat_2417800 [Sesamum alatum]|uniref:Uncharacterized protein n=1 Tax=Sesamum alatum TaxID=300844 RepID=A0AAE2CFA4_9LAMI|nr:hypothetical protein Salat_2417800 [Sesamum alatum]
MPKTLAATPKPLPRNPVVPKPLPREPPPPQNPVAPKPLRRNCPSDQEKRLFLNFLCENSVSGDIVLQFPNMNVSASTSFSMADSTSPVMQSEEETLEHTTNATNEERTIGQEENVEATKDDDTLGS